MPQELLGYIYFAGSISFIRLLSNPCTHLQSSVLRDISLRIFPFRFAALQKAPVDMT
jgi:hypothetical protein